MTRRPTKVERRGSILEAARTVFTRQSYSATRMSDIASQARVGKGTLYEYFPSKEELFATLVLVTMRDALETLENAKVSEDPRLALRETIDHIVAMALVENLDLYRLFYDFWGIAAAHRRLAQKRMREVSRAFYGFLADLVRRGQEQGVFRPEADPDCCARAICASIDGLSLQLVILGDAVDLRGYTAQLQDLVSAGLEAGSALGGASVMKESE